MTRIKKRGSEDPPDERLDFELMIRWLVACCGVLGVRLEDIDITEAIDIVFCHIRSDMPQICSPRDFFQGVFPPKEQQHLPPKLETGLSTENYGSKQVIRGIRSAEQVKLLKRSGIH